MRIKKKGAKYAHQLGKMLAAEVADGNTGGICSFGAVSVDGKEDEEIGGPCHAGLDELSCGYKNFVVDAFYPARGMLTNRSAKKWMRYILEKSPFSSAFAEDNINAGWRRGYYVYDADADSNVLAGCLVAIRMVNETPKIPMMFDLLTKAGTHPDIAFFASYMTGIDDVGKMFINTDSQEGHVSIIPSWFNRQQLLNFFNHEYDEYGAYSETGAYRHFNSMWGQDVAFDDPWDCNGHTDENVSEEIYTRYVEDIKDVATFDERVALFNHQFNEENKEVSFSLNAEEALPLYAKTLNNYREDILNVA